VLLPGVRGITGWARIDQTNPNAYRHRHQYSGAGDIYPYAGYNGVYSSDRNANIDTDSYLDTHHDFYTVRPPNPDGYHHAHSHAHPIIESDRDGDG